MLSITPTPAFLLLLFSDFFPLLQQSLSTSPPLRLSVLLDISLQNLLAVLPSIFFCSDIPSVSTLTDSLGSLFPTDLLKEVSSQPRNFVCPLHVIFTIRTLLWSRRVNICRIRWRLCFKKTLKLLLSASHSVHMRLVSLPHPSLLPNLFSQRTTELGSLFCSTRAKEAVRRIGVAVREMYVGVSCGGLGRVRLRVINEGWIRRARRDLDADSEKSVRSVGQWRGEMGRGRIELAGGTCGDMQIATKNFLGA